MSFLCKCLTLELSIKFSVQLYQNTVDILTSGKENSTKRLIIINEFGCHTIDVSLSRIVSRIPQFRLKSVLHQSVPLREYIFVVDGPVKKEILEILDDARSFITDARKNDEIKTNTGLANALMYGVNCATSKFIIRMDDDDIALPGRFARLAELIQCYPDADIIGAQIVEFTEAEQFRKEKCLYYNSNQNS